MSLLFSRSSVLKRLITNVGLSASFRSELRFLYAEDLILSAVIPLCLAITIYLISISLFDIPQISAFSLKNG